MYRKRLVQAILWCMALAAPAAARAAGIGTWTAYMAYSEVTEVEQAGNLVYVLASEGLYVYNRNDQSLQTFDKANALSDCGISHIAWCQAARRLVIVYANSNIDLLDTSGNVYNLSDFYNKNMTESKTVNAINVEGRYAYLSTDFGILKVNVAAAEISDTYNLGFQVDWTHVDTERIYAESKQQGQYSALLTDNLLDKANWTRTADFTAQERQTDPELLELVATLSPGGPKYNHFAYMRFQHNRLYSVGGFYSVLQDLRYPGCVQVLKDGEWTVFEDGLEEQTGHSYIDLMGIDVDPSNPGHVFAAGRVGVYEFLDGRFVKEYTCDNSPLQVATVVSAGNKNYVIVEGVKFDAAGNLWVLNSMSPSNPILRYGSDGEWTTFDDEALYDKNRTLDNMTRPIIDSRGLLWFVNDLHRVPSVHAYNMQTGELTSRKSFVNQDGTPVEAVFVRCVEEDKSGNIWVGTSVGPLLLSPSDIASGNDVFTQVKVPRNDGTNYADYLLAGVDINCIAVDGAGRKWFGTNGMGAYLISEDNNTQVYHFTASNSSLLSNTVYSIAVDEQTGEVFFGTSKGLCSYMSDATAVNSEMTKDNVWAYPNPVRPDYTGLVTVTGLTLDADVKIVTSNGVLVAQGRSNGGSFTWDARDSRGRRVASGVYMVETATSDGKKGTVCKIAVVN